MNYFNGRNIQDSTHHSIRLTTYHRLSDSSHFWIFSGHISVPMMGDGAYPVWAKSGLTPKQVASSSPDHMSAFGRSVPCTRVPR